MSGQVWAVPEEGGYLYSDELSTILRANVQPASRFRQFCDAEDGTEKGLGAGDKFHWNIVGDVATQGRKLIETQPIPETGVGISQGELTVFEYGNSIPYTGKLRLLGKQGVVQIIDKALRNDCAKALDIAAWEQFDETLLRVAPAGGTSPTSITLTTNGVPGETNNLALGSGHIKTIGDTMRERNIPAYAGDKYMSLGHVTTFRPFKNELEDIHQYTPEGLQMIFRGEIGMYEDFRFCEQNHIPKGGADDSTAFDPYTNTADPWNNALSSWAFFFGADTVTEGVCVPEEIRAKLPGDFGRSKGIAWYYLGGFETVHVAAAQQRILKWDSAA